MSFFVKFFFYPSLNTHSKNSKTDLMGRMFIGFNFLFQMRCAVSLLLSWRHDEIKNRNTVIIARQTMPQRYDCQFTNKLKFLIVP